MTTQPRTIDRDILNLSNGLFDTLPPPPPFEALRDSLVPLMGAEALAPVQVPARRRGARALLGAGLVVALGLSAFALRSGAKHADPAATVSAPVEAAAAAAPIAAPEAVEQAALEPIVLEPIALDPVVIVADLGKPSAPASRIAAASKPQAVPEDLAPVPAATAAPPARELDPAEAGRAVVAAAKSASACAEPDDARTHMSVSVTFAPSGRVTSARITGGPFMGTEAGGCIARTLRGATLAPFAGDPVTVNTSVSLR